MKFAKNPDVSIGERSDEIGTKKETSDEEETKELGDFMVVAVCT